MSDLPIHIYTSPEYFNKITEDVSRTRPGDRVALISMGFDPAEPAIDRLMHELSAAARRGTTVSLGVDAHAFMFQGKRTIPNGPVMRRRSVLTDKRLYYKTKIDALERTREAGGNYRIINVPRGWLHQPYGGRSHIKATVINSTAYLGGCNLSDTDQIDCMIGVQDNPLAGTIYQLITDIIDCGNTRLALAGKDRTVPFLGDARLLIDAGVRQQSLILQQAFELLDSAEQWIVMTCQYFPNSLTAEHLAAAVRRGVKVELYYNHPAKHSAITSIGHQLVLMRERLRRPQALFDHELPRDYPFFHAKLIATDTGTIIGSHNYVTAGVRLGTAEMALLCKDLAVSQRLVAAVKRELGRLSPTR